MVGDNAHCHVGLLLSTVLDAGETADFLYYGLENIGVVVALFALESHAETLESHTGVHMLGGQRLKVTVGATVELHEHKVPNLNHLGMALVNEFHAGKLSTLLVAAEVDMDLAARTARTSCAHFPEVVVLVAHNHAVGGKVFEPVSAGLVVGFEVLILCALKNCGVEAAGVEMKHIYEKLPSPVDNLFFEIVAEAPVS